MTTFIQESLQNGRIARWETIDFPIPFYAEQCRWYAAKGEEYKYNNMVNRALKEWEKRSNGLIRFKIVDKLYDSKINLTWKRVDRKSLGMCSFNFDKCRMFSAEVEIGLSDGILHRKYMDDNEVYHTILHEIGHSVGLGHSKNKSDIMYTPHQYGIVNISNNDIKTLEYIYNLPIGLTGKQMGEQFNINSDDFDYVIAHLEKKFKDDGQYVVEINDNDNSSENQQRNLVDENKRIAELKKYSMLHQNIKIDVSALTHKNIYKKP